MIEPLITTTMTPSGVLGVLILHGQNSIVVLVEDAEGLAELLEWGLTAEAAQAVKASLNVAPIAV